MNEEQTKFIDRLYKDLYLNDSLKKHTTSKDKYQTIKEYIEFLESIHNKTINHNHIDTLKKMYHEKYIIKEENIPYSYYKHQEEMYLERGYGHVNLGDNEKKELQEQIINDQKKSLDTWLDYFLSNDSNYIPFWAKYWAFSGMLKLGNFDKESGKYTKRTKHTISKFADLNREALALSIDTLLKYLDKKDINDQELEQLIKTGSFQSIYTYATNQLLSNSQNIVKRNYGKWIKYNKGRLEDAKKLAESLQGYNTGWCTAGESTAISQVCGGDNYIGGDFYVYYTLDENNEYKVPRIAIRMEDDSIGEIRGIADHQNLEPDMEEVVKEKIKDFPDKDKYYKKVSDMEMLTKIYKKHNNKEELTKGELILLYELDSKIEGFGYEKDPRIEEILNYRDVKKDIAYALDIEESQIATWSMELNENTVVYVGDLYKNNCIQSLYLPSLKIITGDAYFDQIESAEGLEKLEHIGGLANFPFLEDSKGLENLRYIGKTAYFNYLRNAEGLKSLKHIGGSVRFEKLKNSKGLENLEYIGGYAEFKSLESANGLCRLKYIGDIAGFRNLKTSEGLENLEYIGEDAYFDSLKSASGLKNLKHVGFALYFDQLDSLEHFVFPEKCFVIHFSMISNINPEQIPDPLTYNIHLANNVIITPENVEEYKALHKKM